MPKFIDLTGKTFGRWKVLKYMGKSRWLCECSCEEHTRRVVDGQSLRIDGTKEQWKKIGRLLKDD